LSTIPQLSPLARAIANAEGYGVPGAIPTVNNNPGDLSSGGNILTYGSINDGMSALQSQVNAMLNGTSKYYDPSMTIADVGKTYANGDPAWSSNVANYLGVPENTPIGQIPSTTAPASSPARWTKYLPGVGNSLSGGEIMSTIFGARFLMFIIGLILITAGVFSFKTTTTVIKSTTKAVKKGAETYASV
jgi:hypothetical protein